MCPLRETLDRGEQLAAVKEAIQLVAPQGLSAVGDEREAAARPANLPRMHGAAGLARVPLVIQKDAWVSSPLDH